MTLAQKDSQLSAPCHHAIASAPNTPQAALVLLNDPTYVEAARVLAEQTLREGGSDDDRRLTWIWRRVLSRRPDPHERALLATLLEKRRRNVAADGPDRAEVAAWTAVARVLLNLDETITRN